MNRHRPLTFLSLFMMIASFLAAAVFFSGCGGLKNDYTEKQMFRLRADNNAAQTSANRSAGVPLTVKRLDISPEFGSAEIVYRVDENRFTQDYYNNYMTPPARMISEVVLEALVGSPQFAPVPKNRVPDNFFQIWGKITELYYDRRDTSGASAVVTMALHLDRLDKNGFTKVFAKTYRAKVPLGADTSPKSYIKALNHGLGGIVDDILSDFQRSPLSADNQ